MGTERLLDLLDDVTAYCSAQEPTLDRWAETLREEIAEREAPLPVRDLALTSVLEKLDALKRGEGSLEDVRRHVEGLGARGFREVTRAQWAALACDAAQETGEIPSELRGAVARLLPALIRSLPLKGNPEDLLGDPLVKALRAKVHGPWVVSHHFNVPAVVRRRVLGFSRDWGWSVGVFRQSAGDWMAQTPEGGPSFIPKPMRAQEAMKAVDAALLEAGEILLGEEEDFLRGLGGFSSIEEFFASLNGKWK